MKIATALISLFLGLIILVQSCAVATTAHLTSSREITNAGSVGVLVGFLFFVAGSFAFALPLVSAVLLTVSGLLGLMASRHFEDLGVWAWAAFALAIMAGWAWRSQRAAQSAPVTDGPQTRVEPSGLVPTTAPTAPSAPAHAQVSEPRDEGMSR